MVKSPAVIVRQPGALVPPMETNGAANGLMLISQALDADLVEAFADVGRFRALVCDNGVESYVGEDQREPRVGYLDRAKQLHRSWLPLLARAVAINDMLRDLLNPRVPISHGEASAMIAHMLGAMGKRRGDDVAPKLLALADMFSPATNVLGEVLGLWKAVPTSPTVLALAIKTLMAKQIFEPSEAELRAALATARQKVVDQQRPVRDWLRKIERADALVFAYARAEWDAAYALLDSRAALYMASLSDTDAARCHVLDELWRTKCAAEEAAAFAAPAATRTAACAATQPTKRNSKPLVT